MGQWHAKSVGSTLNVSSQPHGARRAPIRSDIAIQRRAEEVRGGFNTSAIWREPPNHWRAITRLDVAVQVTALVPPRTVRLNQHHLAEPTMNRDDVLVWLSLAWFAALCGAAIWVLFPL